MSQMEQVTAVVKFNDDELKKIEEIKKQFNPKDTGNVIQYGIGAQQKIASFADTVLSEIRNKDAGFVGNILGDLVIKIKDLHVDNLSSGNVLGNVPFIGQLFNKVRKFITHFEHLNTQIEKIIDELEKARMQLLRDITLLDKLHEKNGEYLHELDMYVAAGKMLCSEIKDNLIVELKRTAQESKDPLDSQKVQDADQMLDRLEKKVHDLELSRMVSLQTSPQIRLIQNNNQLLVEKIQTSILTTIPLWKNQVVIAVSLFRQEKAMKLQREVTDTTNDLLAKNSEMLKESSLGVARESERGIVEIETLKKVNADLISTIEETIKIQEEGRSKRLQAEIELVRMEDELKRHLSKIRS
jgi:uncharacterized protein YaaN involved in tellurite resistance